MKKNPWMDRFEAVDKKFREENRAYLIAKGIDPDSRNLGPTLQERFDAVCKKPCSK